ncbi:MAG: NADH-quinone oxidoreductase subunit L [Rhodospirillales bacterium]
MPAVVVFLPLLGAILAGILALAPAKGSHGHGGGHGGGHAGGPFDRVAQLITCGALLASMVAAIFVFVDVVVHGSARTEIVFTWIASGDFRAEWALKVDTLTAVMMLVVTIVSAMVHVYSIGYMHHDHCIPRFMAYLNLFTFFMLMLITADNLLQLFFGWEGVGLASYLLIGFWYDRPSANAAAIKAFVVNRVGDVGFMLGILAAFFVFGTNHLDAMFAAAPAHAGTVVSLFGADLHAMTLICLLLFVGAMGKSAQLGLHTWLPDAMEGPTPVSALIHAATMVTAGVFLVARMSPLFEYSDTALAVVTIVGALTCFFAATIGCVQNDIKRVIAYSTCSQLGYMFFALGVSAYGAGIFHLATHASFKALLFLGAGSVIHAMSDEQDMRKMGGIWRLVPVTYVLMWIGSLALAGIWPFSGYFSKDIILESAYAADTGVGRFAFWIGIAAAFMTAFYSWRLILMTFHGTPRAEDSVMARVHESPLVMLLPMAVLAVGACVVGYVGYEWFVGDGMHEFWRHALFVLPQHPALHEAHHVPEWVKLLPLGVGVAGIALAYVMYMFVPGLPARLAGTFQAVYRFLLNKWYFDELYDWLFVRPAFAIGRGFWKGGDGQLIDGLGPDGVAATALRIARGASRLQTGYIFHYAFAMLIGVLILVSWYLLRVAG